ncbi:hypothetical protein C8J56DRAFT_952698 [Mycena floridula]|nr:hypothetical protein C8J56DRAFT_952698 [Mycena floridula]
MTIRVLALLKRKSGTSTDEFRKYWSTEHANMFVNLQAVKDNLVRYSQFHVLADETATLTGMGLPVAQFDGVAELYVEKLEDLLKLFGDKDYLEKSPLDEAKFLDPAATQILVGENILLYERKL